MSASCASDHRVQFYALDAELAVNLEHFVRTGLEANASVVLVATEPHLRATEERVPTNLWRRGIAAGQLTTLDAGKMLSSLYDGDRLDGQRFGARVGSLLTRGRKASPTRSVRFFGEMVALHTSSGDFERALELERHWNEAMEREPFELLCAYPLAHFPSPAHCQDFESVCDCHSDVLPAATRREPRAGHHDVSRLLALLGQQTLAAETEARRREETEAELVEASKDRLMALIASEIVHDFNNYLQVMDMSVQFLASTRLDEAQWQAIVDMRAAAERARGLAARAMALGRRAPKRNDAIGLSDTVSDLSPLLRRAAGRDVDLRLCLADGLPPICVDQAALEQALLNLVLNARQALDGCNAPRITLTTRQVGERQPQWPPDIQGDGFVILEVEDNGPGIPPPLRSRIFQEFFTTRLSGSGLGLAAVARLAKDSGGWVSVQAPSGHGSAFSLIFPTSQTSRSPH